jgi:hypothetical protein
MVMALEGNSTRADVIDEWYGIKLSTVLRWPWEFTGGSLVFV